MSLPRNAEHIREVLLAEGPLSVPDLARRMALRGLPPMNEELLGNLPERFPDYFTTTDDGKIYQRAFSFTDTNSIKFRKFFECILFI